MGKIEIAKQYGNKQNNQTTNKTRAKNKNVTRTQARRKQHKTNKTEDIEQ